MANNKHKKYQGMRHGKNAPGMDRLAETRALWTNLNGLSFVVYVRTLEEGGFYDSLPDELKEKYEEFREGDNISLHIKAGQRQFSLGLTGFTVEELDTFKAVVNQAIRMSEPIVKARDKLSQEAYDEHDDDSFDRIYRAVPRVFVRARHVGEHYSRLLQRFARAGAVVAQPRARREAGEHDGSVDHGDEGGRGTSDDEPQAG